MSEKANLKKVTLKTPIMDVEWQAGGKAQSFGQAIINKIRRYRYNKWKTRSTQVQKIKFPYLSYDLDRLPNQTDAILNLLKNYGWSGLGIDQCTLLKMNVYNVDGNIFALVTDLEPGCLDYYFDSSKANGEIVEYIVDDQVIIGGLYVIITVRDENGNLDKKCINITTVKKDPEIGPHGDGSYEWKAYAPSTNIKKGWQAIIVNIPLILKRRAFNGKYTFVNIVGVRLRGRAKIVSINTYSEAPTKNI